MSDANFERLQAERDELLRTRETERRRSFDEGVQDGTNWANDPARSYQEFEAIFDPQDSVGRMLRDVLLQPTQFQSNEYREGFLHGIEPVWRRLKQ